MVSCAARRRMEGAIIEMQNVVEDFSCSELCPHERCAPAHTHTQCAHAWMVLSIYNRITTTKKIVSQCGVLYVLHSGMPTPTRVHKTTDHLIRKALAAAPAFASAASASPSRPGDRYAQAGLGMPCRCRLQPSVALQHPACGEPRGVTRDTTACLPELPCPVPLFDRLSSPLRARRDAFLSCLVQCCCCCTSEQTKTSPSCLV